MQLIFSAALLVFSLLFTFYGLSTLELYDPIGRPGPGYFPLIIGVLLIIFTAVNCIKDFKNFKDFKGYIADAGKLSGCGGSDQTYFKDSAVTLGLITIFILTLEPLGSILSMLVFTGLFLLYFNKGKHLFNVVYGLMLPIGVYLLFEVLLRAGLPKGIFDY